MRLYRVFPAVKGARRDRPGGALFVPAVQGAGRIDNPERYAVLYAAAQPAAAVGEMFGDLHRWVPAMLGPKAYLPGSFMALATLDSGAVLLDLDDPDELSSRGLRPSQVVTRDRGTTQAWALRVWRERRYGGVSWWSMRDADWTSAGTWDRDGTDLVASEPLTLDHPALVEAADTLAIPIEA